MSILPRLTEADFEDSSISAYFGAMGFEDRSLMFLRQIHTKKSRLGHVFAINYLPTNKKNRNEDFLKLAREVSDDVRILTYDRFSPEAFSRLLTKVAGGLTCKKAIVDISGLTRLGIVIILTALATYEGPLTVFYTEAETYHPTREDYDKERDKLGPSGPPTFLTTGVYDVLSTSSLSSVSMPGSPLALLAFPTFNHVELGALLNEITPEQLFLVNGIPPSPHNRWRLDAISELNRNVRHFVNKERSVSTLSYDETLNVLNDFYSDVQFTHRLVVAPTGSKMQSVGVSLFKQVHPDVQIIHPVAEGYFPQYTEGVGKVWQLDFDEFSRSVETLRLMRKSSIFETISLIEEHQRRQTR